MIDQVKESQNDMSSGNILSRGPGIVVLSPSLQILHMNRQAITLASLLGSAEPNGQPSNDPTGILPPPLTDMAGEILSELRTRHEMSEKGQFEIRHVADESGKPVCIRGVGVPNGQGVEHARIVLALTDMSTA
jgi:hypothetical protein